MHIHQILISVPDASPCTAGWHYYNGNCFYTSSDKDDQATARSECQNKDANLTSVSDRAEMDFVAGIS